MDLLIFTIPHGPHVDGISITYKNTYAWTCGIGNNEKSNSLPSNCPYSQFPGHHLLVLTTNGRLFNNITTTTGAYDHGFAAKTCCFDLSLPWLLPLTRETLMQESVKMRNEDVLVKEIKLLCSILLFFKSFANCILLQLFVIH